MHGGERSSSAHESEESKEEDEEEGEEENEEEGKEANEEDARHKELLIDLGDSSPSVDQRSTSAEAHQPSESSSRIVGAGGEGWEDWGPEWGWDSNQHN